MCFYGGTLLSAGQRVACAGQYIAWQGKNLLAYLLHLYALSNAGLHLPLPCFMAKAFLGILSRNRAIGAIFLPQKNDGTVHLSTSLV